MRSNHEYIFVKGLSMKKECEEEIQNNIMEMLYEKGYLFMRAYTQGIARVIGGKLILTPNGGRIINKLTKERLGSMVGCSDLIVLHDGIAIFMEVKTPIGEMSEGQHRFCQKVMKEGFAYIVVTSVEEAEDKLLDILINNISENGAERLAV